ncbi:MAG: hypothetical protein RJB53_530, partial [Pseudomonadota bacterium]
ENQSFLARHALEYGERSRNVSSTENIQAKGSAAYCGKEAATGNGLTIAADNACLRVIDKLKGKFKYLVI